MLLKYGFKTRKNLREVELSFADQLESVDIGSKAIFFTKKFEFHTRYTVPASNCHFIRLYTGRIKSHLADNNPQ